MMMIKKYLTAMGEMRNAYKILGGKPDGKRLLSRAGHRWENNNKMDLAVHRGQWLAFVNMVINLWVA
jgi:hypothetical protein